MKDIEVNWADNSAKKNNKRKFK